MYSAPLAIGGASFHGCEWRPGGIDVFMSMIGISRRVVAEPIQVPTPSEEPAPRREPAEPPQPVART
jgi:hypothetical protein